MNSTGYCPARTRQRVPAERDLYPEGGHGSGGMWGKGFNLKHGPTRGREWIREMGRLA
ncbi:MAG: hypothetical protein VCG02_20500 [Verrucomicrobiota bacterium]